MQLESGCKGSVLVVYHDWLAVLHQPRYPGISIAVNFNSDLHVPCAEFSIPFKEILLNDNTVTKHLTSKEIDSALDPKNYIGTAVEQVELVIKKLS